MSSSSRAILHRLVPTTAAAAVLALAASAAAVASPGVSPGSYDDAMNPGASVTITKTVETPPIPPKPDIVLMADTTGSMRDSIANVRANAGSIVSQVQGAQPDAQFAVAEYKDDESSSPFAYRVDQQLTGSSTDVQNGINQWSQGGGGDEPEAWIGALGRVPSTVSFRPGSTRVLVMFGDAPSHDPSLGFTEATATNGLTGAGIQVIAISVPGPIGARLDLFGQASRITSATGGSLASANPDEVAATILSQLRNLPAVVTHDSTCDPGVSTSFDQAAQTVTSGDTTTFQETISLASDAAQGQTLTCTTRFLVNGELPGPEFVQTVHIKVNDVTPPEVTVESKTVEATGPSGANVSYDATAVDNVDGPLTPTCTPPSGSLFALGATGTTCTATDAAGNTGTGHGTITVVDTTPPSAGCPEGPNPGGAVPASKNPDGFFRLTGSDLVDTAPQIWLRDTGSGTVFGPYADGQKIKYTQNGATPSVKPMPGGILKITGTGDAAVWATDFSGNSSAPVMCLVPRPPK